MINKYKTIISLLFISLIGFTHAQNLESDAINFGTNNTIGTARNVGVGGAMSAVGGDVSNMGYNPAGIGVYKSSVLSITPSYEINKSDVVFLNSSFQNQNAKFNIANVGAVFNLKNKRFSLFENFNIGFSLNALNSFHQKNEFNRYTSSRAQDWLAEAIEVNGNTDGTFTYDKFSFETVGAYYSYLVNFDTSILEYTTPINNSIQQRSITERKGGKRDFNITTGANLFNKLYLGAGISIPFINYRSTTEFYEEDINDLNGDFENFNLTNKYTNTGTGFNASFGFIYKPVNFLRVSGAFKTNTRYRMSEEYTSDFVTNFETVSYIDSSAQGKYKYSMRTPWRGNAGIALVSKKLGFISFDYELVDFTTTKFFMDKDGDITQNTINKELENQLNSNIQDKYQIAHNFKVGVEAKIKKFRIRGGYNLQTSPLKETFRIGNNDFSRQQFSGGIGYLWEKISLDASYRYSMSNEFEVSYDGVNGLSKNTDRQLFLVSLGIKLGK